jgi:hypothetical protein
MRGTLVMRNATIVSQPSKGSTNWNTCGSRAKLSWNSSFRIATYMETLDPNSCPGQTGPARPVRGLPGHGGGHPWSYKIGPGAHWLVGCTPGGPHTGRVGWTRLADPVWLMYQFPGLLNHKWWPHIVVFHVAGVPWTSLVHQCSFEHARESYEPPVVVLQCCWECANCIWHMETLFLSSGTFI